VVSLKHASTKQSKEHKATGSDTENAIGNVMAENLTRVSRRMVKRIDECIQNNEGYLFVYYIQ
jgi:hypothetical protein